MWEIVAWSVECQRAAFEAQARGIEALRDQVRAGAAATDATREAAEANAKAWRGWWRLWGGR